MPPIVSNQSLTPAVGGGSQQPLTGAIPLSQLIEFIVQRTYHELTVLSELLVFYTFTLSANFCFGSYFNIRHLITVIVQYLFFILLMFQFVCVYVCV